MRPGGLCLVLDLAVGALQHPLVSRYAVALKLGSLREDVRYLPGLGRVVESLSLGHCTGAGLPGGFLPLLWPGPAFWARRGYRRALRELRAGRTAAAFVRLGRVAHLLADMACPVHVQRVAHLDDPFEWYVDGNATALARLAVPAPPRVERVEELVLSLAAQARRHRADRTNNPLGRLLRRLGWRRPLRRAEVAEQARELVPAAAAHTVALLALFLREAGLG